MDSEGLEIDILVNKNICASVNLALWQPQPRRQKGSKY